MIDQLQEQKNLKFAGGHRGDRLSPGRTDRSFWHLKILGDRLKGVVDSDLLPSGEKVLDYGCGNRPYERLFAKKFKEYIGADLPGNKDAQLVIGPEGRLPVDNRTFDCVLSSEVLEHTINPDIYLREAHRVLKPEGSLILSAPAIWVYHPDPIDYWRWTIDGLQAQIRRAGFDIVTTKGVFGPESSALQLWQDSTFDRLPRLIQPLYTWFFQSIIGLIERRHPNKLSNDASVYVVLAQRPRQERA